MDKDWIDADRMSQKYEDGINMFFEFAENFARETKCDMVYCPCAACHNLSTVDLKKLRKHLGDNGFDRGYTRWIWHGESTELSSCDGGIDKDEHNHVRLGDMINEVVEDPDVLNALMAANEKPLYPGSSLTRLESVLRLYNLKAASGWTDVSFTALLKLLKEILPSENELPEKTYEAKKILCPMGMEVRKIHACPNDCMLYMGEYIDASFCKKCKTSRYKLKSFDIVGDDPEGDGVSVGVEIKKGPPAKVLWYLPPVERLKRMFANPEDAKHLTWHADREIPNGDSLLRHPADSPQWKIFDMNNPEFAAEPGNLRIAIITDGINPHGNMSSKYSSWPVLFSIYNLPPWLCMKRKYIMLTLMISGPKQPGNDIDVYLRPLIDDLKKLWMDGELVYDAYRKKHFTLKAMVFCTFVELL